MSTRYLHMLTIPFAFSSIHDSLQALSDIVSIPMPDDDQGYPPLHPLDGSEYSIPLSDGDLVAIFEIFNDQQKSNPSPDPLAELNWLMDRIAALPPSERPVAKETALAGSVALQLDGGSHPMPNDPQSYPGDSQGPVEMSDLEGCDDIMLLSDGELQAALNQLSHEQIDELYSLFSAFVDPATPAVDENAPLYEQDIDMVSEDLPSDDQSLELRGMSDSYA
ncbi:hypothetical protein EDB19DRAFT_1676872 [Suillus lakei]|nr:hypothetical protein EDB19DRAFT_1676872 [Suillus lakei]